MRRILRAPVSRPIAVALAVYATVLAFFVLAGFSRFHGDVGWYWVDSVRWQEPFNAVHVPAYPLLIAAARGLTGNVIEPSLLMGSLTLVAQIVGTWLTYRTIEAFASERAAAAGACLYVLWPLVGTNYAAFPVSDSIGKAVFLAALYSLVRRRYLLAGAFLGLTTVAHKGLWVPAALLAVLLVVEAVRGGERSRAAGAALLSAAPILALWAAGIRHHGSVDWIFADSLRAEAASRSELPLADGMIGSMLYGGWPGVVKGVMTVAVLVGAASVIVVAWRSKGMPVIERWAAVAVAGPIALLAIVLNQSTIFATIRFTPLLVVPLCWFFGDRLDALAPPRWRRTAVVAGVVLLAAQLAFAAYLVDFYVEPWPA